MNLVPYIKAQYSILYLVTPEESRAEAAINETAKELKRSLVVWSHTEGMFSPANPKKSTQIEDPIEALVHIKGAEIEANTIVVMRDLSPFFSEPKVIRHLRDIARDFKQSKKTLIITSPIRKIPPELERDVTVIEFELPLHQDIKAIFDLLYEGAKVKIGKLSDDERERIVQAALGLTTIEAENALAKSIVEYVNNEKTKKAPQVPQAISKLVLKEKALAVKKSGILEYLSGHPDGRGRRGPREPQGVAQHPAGSIHCQGPGVRPPSSPRRLACGHSRLRKITFREGLQQHLGDSPPETGPRPHFRRPRRRVRAQHAHSHTNGRGSRRLRPVARRARESVRRSRRQWQHRWGHDAARVWLVHHLDAGEDRALLHCGHRQPHRGTSPGAAAEGTL